MASYVGVEVLFVRWNVQWLDLLDFGLITMHRLSLFP